ncbi:MAG: DNA-directed RNA polymerase subunit H [Methanomassiliicoccales archaeon]|nr:DNA-directed RNA polymerase subunit H [Methanomassiliicoccales archaeon]
MPRFNVMENYLVPRHTIIPEEEVEKLLEKYSITKAQLPKILMMDPCAKALNAKSGDVIQVERQSPTAGTSLYYRLVVEERSTI